MTKKQYLKLGKKHKINVNEKMTINEIKNLLAVEAKNSFTHRTSPSDIKIILDILKIKHQDITDKNYLLELLKNKTIDKSFKGIDVKGIDSYRNKESGEPVISVRNLNVSFRNIKKKKAFVNIIRGISFDVYRGQIVGFIGESGSGKSVSSKSLFGMNIGGVTTADKMMIGGINMLENNSSDKVISKNKDWRKIRAKKISYIPQNPMTSLNPTMKIINQLTEVLDQMPENENKSSTEKKKIIIDILEKFGITNAKDKIGQYPHEFSGGMRQRVVIAMAILSKPEVIIADEPTTALDPTIQASVLSLFKDIAKEYNMAIIFVSHDISVISTLCDYVNVFYAGRIVEKASTYDLFTNSKHPYTWALLSSMPESNKDGSSLYTLDGAPPSFDTLPAGDPFSVRNKYAMEIDFKEEPPLFVVNESKKHFAATWLLHENSPSVQKPKEVIEIAKAVRKDLKNGK